MMLYACLYLEWFFFRQLSVVNGFICNDEITCALINIGINSEKDDCIKVKIEEVNVG